MDFKTLTIEEQQQNELDFMLFMQAAGNDIREEHAYFGESFYEGGDDETAD